MPDDPVDQLYGLDPKDFVVARNDLAKRLRKEGDKTGAAEVAKLRRPSPAAWAVNQLVRHHRSDVEELVRLGAQLRAAQDDALAGGEPADLRQAGRARREAVSRLAGMAEALLDERGTGAGAHAGEVGATLEAASLDADAGATVLAGRLAEDLRPPSGFGVFDDVPAEPRPRPKPAPATDDADDRARREAEAAADDARRRWEERTAQARAAVGLVTERRREVEEAEAEVARLEDLLDGARRRRGDAARAADVAEDAASRAEDAAARAAKELRECEQRLSETSPG